jgi:hypothetical protein
VHIIGKRKRRSEASFEGPGLRKFFGSLDYKFLLCSKCADSSIARRRDRGDAYNERSPHRFDCWSSRGRRRLRGERSLRHGEPGDPPRFASMRKSLSISDHVPIASLRPRRDRVLTPLNMTVPARLIRVRERITQPTMPDWTVIQLRRTIRRHSQIAIPRKREIGPY